MRIHFKTLSAAFAPKILATTAFVVALGTLSPGAHADLSLSAVGLLNFSNETISPSPASNSSFAMGTSVGFGFLGSASVFPGFSLELGALYVPRKVSTNDASGVNLQTVTSKNIEIPLLLRFNGLPLISVGAGPYYAHTTGSLTLAQPGKDDVSLDYSTTTAAQSDFGLEASIAASLPVLPFISVMGDLRYLVGLTNLDSSGATTQHYRDFQFLAGVTLSL